MLEYTHSGCDLNDLPVEIDSLELFNLPAAEMRVGVQGILKGDDPSLPLLFTLITVFLYWYQTPPEISAPLWRRTSRAWLS